MTAKARATATRNHGASPRRANRVKLDWFSRWDMTSCSVIAAREKERKRPEVERERERQTTWGKGVLGISWKPALDGCVVPLPVLINHGNCTAIAKRNTRYARDNARGVSTEGNFVMVLPSCRRAEFQQDWRTHRFTDERMREKNPRIRKCCKSLAIMRLPAVCHSWQAISFFILFNEYSILSLTLFYY